ncbi:MAG: hypothetical protein OXF49_00375 [Candidatus Saccharibacteria bacterium]|nr:hypothetical protein [Candidatus Saccharibacteria bacterium]
MSLSAKLRRKLSIYGLNTLGIFLLLLIPFIGPLPGPGGIPLLIAGLKLLSVHNKWAQQLQDFIKKKGLGLSDLLFPQSSNAQIIWDLGILWGWVLSISILVIYSPGGIWMLLISTLMTTLGVCWLRNHYRWQRFLIYLKINKKIHK